MKFNRTKMTYSLLGNYVPFLTGNEQKIRTLMADFALQTRAEKLPNGNMVTDLLYNKNNVRISYGAFRIDFEYTFANLSCSVQAGFRAACDFFKLLGKHFDAKGARIALVSTLFTDNTDGAATKHLAEHFGMSSIFGDCQEFTFRINTVRPYFETVNSVLDIRPGEATNNTTGIKTPILMAVLDINTVKENTEHRFHPAGTETLFFELLSEEQEKVSVLMGL
ncbi:MAG: hypothetical protein IJY22_04850 [Clostridia bacterium]|nr:hypothetical protein [Clostridia bacterium]